MSSPPAPTFDKRRTKFVAGAVVIAAALVSLIGWAMARPDATALYLTVGELQAMGGSPAGRSLRVNGKVVPGTIERRGLDTTFVIADAGRRLRVRTTEPLPDAFRNGSEVVARGRYDGQRLLASEVLAKCPSKFEAA
jgi:cytochrome c-type biogenesis protein CcmE